MSPITSLFLASTYPFCFSLSGYIFSSYPRNKSISQGPKLNSLTFPFCSLSNKDQLPPTNPRECQDILIIFIRTQVPHSCQESHNLNPAPEGEASPHPPPQRKTPRTRNKGQSRIWPSQWGQLSLKWDWQASLCHQTQSPTCPTLITKKPLFSAIINCL